MLKLAAMMLVNAVLANGASGALPPPPKHPHRMSRHQAYCLHTYPNDHAAFKKCLAIKETPKDAPKAAPVTAIHPDT